VLITMNRDVAKLDIRLLMAFDALISERNVTRAAAQIGLTQQGMSGQLARLRDTFGDPLFVRARGGILPTPRSEELAPLVRHALESLEPLVSPPSFEPASFEGTVAIAASDYALAFVMPSLLDRLHKAAPGLRMIVRNAETESIDSDLRHGAIDVALTVPQFMQAGFNEQHLFDERYVGVARRNHPILSRQTVTIDSFCAHSHLLVSPFRGDAIGPTDESLAALGRRRKIGLVVPGFLVAGALLARTDLIAVLPERLAITLQPAIEVFELPVRVPGFALCAYWPARLEVSRMHCWLRDEIAASIASH